MRYLKTIILLWVSILACLTANAQSANSHTTSAGGGSLSLPGGNTLDFTIGEPFIATIGTTPKFTQGLHQTLLSFSVTDVNSPNVITAYKEGGVVLVTVTFSQPVLVTGVPELALNSGGKALYTSGSGTTVLTFTYTVAAAENSTDLDYSAIGSLTLAGGSTIQNSLGTNAPLTLPVPGTAGSLAANKDIIIDTQAPTQTIATTVFSNDANASGTYFLTNTASQTVSGTLSANLVAGEIVEVSFNNGTSYAPATITAGDNAWSIATTLTASNTLKVRVVDALGNIGTEYSKGYIYDIVPPTATLALASSALKIGSTSLLTITFSEAVTNFANADLTIMNGTLTAVNSGDGGVTWTATFTPTNNFTSLINSITLDKLGLTDLAGNAGAGTSATANYTIDTQAPTLSSVTIASDNTVPTRAKVGNTATLTFTASESVQTPVVTIAGHTVTPTATGNNWTATYTFVSGDTEGLVAYNITFSDLAGNAGTAVTTGTGSVTFDKTAPTLSAVNIASNNTTPTLAKIGDVATLTFTSSKTVQTPTVTIAGHTVTPTAVGNNWTATYTFVSGDTEGQVAYNIAFSDFAGNAGAAVTTGTGSVTLDKTAPVIPAGLAATSGDTQIILNWTANTETDLSKYRITYGTNPASLTSTVDVAAGTTTYTNTGLTNGTTYYYQIQALDQAGNISAASANVSAIPKANQSITFNAIALKTYGDPTFQLGNANSSGGLPVTYIATDPTVVSIAGNVATILKSGNTVITASQAGTISFNAAANVQQTLTVTQKLLTITANNRVKTYGDVVTFTGNEYTSVGLSNTDAITSVNFSTTGAAATATVASSTYPIVASAATGTGLNNYNITYLNGALTVARRALTITADPKEKFLGAVNPVLTVTYTGLTNGETNAILTTQPTITTTALTGSPIGDYPITANGAAAANYAITYATGNLKIKSGIPTSITLAAITLYENSASGTNAGTLSSTSDDPSVTFTYTLVAGTGDADNALFAIAGNKLNTNASLDYESKAVYKVRLRSTTQYGQSLDKELSITLSDVNEIPTLAAISNQAICFTTAGQTVALTGISAGPETTQTTALTVSSNNPNLFDALGVTGTGATATINYRIKAGAIAGTATVTVTVKDNGGTANGGVDTYSRTFTITVNALPVISINSDKGIQISKGEQVLLSATGGTSYTWAANSSINGALSSATIEVRPRETTTYTVTATNASGCSESKTFTLTVLEDYEKVNATNIMSPNGDGINDKWLIYNIDFYPNNEVKIFDKAGRLMYSKKGYDNSWDATLNGSPLAEGTYYYIIDFGTNRRSFKGFITVVKND